MLDAAELELGFHRRFRAETDKSQTSWGLNSSWNQSVIFQQEKSVFLYLSTQKSLLTSLLGHLPLKDTHTVRDFTSLS